MHTSFDGRVVIVGASLAGLRAAEGLREAGFTGSLTLIGDEAYPPYDRPPLSKTVLAGRIPANHTFLPQIRDINAGWLLGKPATALHLSQRVVELADGRTVPYDRLLITTGTRARPWPDAQQAAIDGVCTIRTLDDSARLYERLTARPKRVLVIGAGFTGSEVASICREQGLAVTVVERSTAPMASALGGAAGMIAAQMQRKHGVDLRCNVTVMALEADTQGKLCCAHLSDGDQLPVDLAIVALGAVRNVEWLEGAGLAADARGVVCDASCRVFDANDMVRDDIFVAGDVARWPHPLFQGQLLAVEHWGNAVAQAAIAAHNMVCAPSERQPHRHIPTFWSNQFGSNIKSVGLPTVADEIVVTQGSVAEQRFVATYGQQGRVVAAVAVNMPRWLEFYGGLIEQKAAFPPLFHAPDAPAVFHIVPAGFPAHGQSTHSPGVEVTGPGPNTPASANDTLSESSPADPRVPAGPTPL
jgi:NADPH-dependent 2,4-dienoyl-CoA reductase/sulfur reductase-like enzyme